MWSIPILGIELWSNPILGIKLWSIPILEKEVQSISILGINVCSYTEAARAHGLRLNSEDRTLVRAPHVIYEGKKFNDLKDLVIFQFQFKFIQFQGTRCVPIQFWDEVWCIPIVGIEVWSIPILGNQLQYIPSLGIQLWSYTLQDRGVLNSNFRIEMWSISKLGIDVQSFQFQESSCGPIQFQETMCFPFQFQISRCGPYTFRDRGVVHFQI